ncbi:hypothetical protein LR68_01873 [Anoxybacillus sp. BCO1]|nr:hypothetical protein LR68_01873 [Anoxybacillus sp. BCO1]
MRKVVIFSSLIAIMIIGMFFMARTILKQRILAYS